MKNELMDKLKLTKEEKEILIKTNLQNITDINILEEKLSEYLQQKCIINDEVTNEGNIVESILDKISLI